MQMTEFCDHLYNDSTDGYIQILKLNDENNNGDKTIKIYNTKNEGLREIVEVFNDEDDVFLSPNTMYLPKRRVENIRQFRALFQDIDCNKVGFEKAETAYIVWQLYYDGKIPKPTMVTDSGRGVHLYWRIQNAPYGALNTWQELQDYIYYQLKHLGADRKSTDGARVLRLPGTINSKNEEDCKVLYIDNELEYSMYDLREQYLNYKPKSHQLEIVETKKNDTKVVSNKFFNSYSLHMERSNDLQTLCKLRKYDMTGFRNMVIHCYVYWKGIYVRDSYELENIVMELNNAFTEPLKEIEIRAILRSVPKAIDKFIAYEQGLRCGERKRVSKGMRDKEGYWYKNDTLIERLDISTSEQKHMKTIIGVDEKYDRNNERRRKSRRNEEGLTKREKEKLDTINELRELVNKGLKNKDIAEKLSISVRQVQRLKQEI
ncbi:DNA-binding response regulator [Romboutsia sedimentorum]|uniref:DNA-binding response regulator n=1 Tax=Romboutsia sedimentorum TaxID=1368474 RepID=A0ABT7EB56_9FIRM|nr:DNA-binding response regulator [Romboutsia sedimentorum]MDK2564164.1 DNA-binding response regulator [Romboutsia sedimentorum]